MSIGSSNALVPLATCALALARWESGDSPKMTPCPDDNLLVRVAAGEARAEELAGLDGHLDECSDCRKAIAAAASDRTLPEKDALRPLRSGEPVARYAVGRLLGAGGMGVVHEAFDPVLDRKVALKVLRSSEEAESRVRLQREAQTMARLSHPNLVPVFELGEWGRRLFLVMELIDGVSFDVWRVQAERPLVERVRLLLEAGRGLAAAHACGVVHRDFKPANVLVGSDCRARVTDFGLSRLTEAGPSAPSQSMLETQAGTLIGTPAYMAPEQLDGGVADARSDQFSFCVAFAEALSGERPFAAPTCKALREAMRGAPKLGGVPRRYRKALAKGLSEDPAARFVSMDALLRALSRKPVAARVTAAAVAVLALAAVTTWSIARASGEQVEVAVAAVDLREGETMTADKLEVRPVPKRLVTSSVVRPLDTRYIVNQPLVVPVQAGDMLLWSQFEQIQKKETAAVGR